MEIMTSIAMYAIAILGTAHGVKMAWNTMASHSCKSEMNALSALNVSIGIVMVALGIDLILSL